MHVEIIRNNMYLLYVCIHEYAESCNELIIYVKSTLIQMKLLSISVKKNQIEIKINLFPLRF